MAPKPTQGTSQRTFDVVVTRDPEGWYVAIVPALPGCLTQAKTRRTLRARVKEAIHLSLDDPEPIEGEFVGIEQVTVEVPAKP
ncbi:MAG: type II toxin-antitoxin system HicB family antitoxin [Thermoplasmatota archaeon]